MTDAADGGVNGRGWSVPGSNRRPPACKAGALPAELTPLRRGSTPATVKTIPAALPAGAGGGPRSCPAPAAPTETTATAARYRRDEGPEPRLSGNGAPPHPLPVPSVSSPRRTESPSRLLVALLFLGACAAPRLPDRTVTFMHPRHEAWEQNRTALVEISGVAPGSAAPGSIEQLRQAVASAVAGSGLFSSSSDRQAQDGYVISLTFLAWPTAPGPIGSATREVDRLEAHVKVVDARQQLIVTSFLILIRTDAAGVERAAGRLAEQVLAGLRRRHAADSDQAETAPRI